MADFELTEINASSPVTQAAAPVIYKLGRVVYLAFAAIPVAVILTLNFIIERTDSSHNFQHFAISSFSLVLCFIMMGIGTGLLVWAKLNDRHAGFWKFALFFSSLPFLYYFFGFIIYSMLNAPSVIPAWR